MIYKNPNFYKKLIALALPISLQFLFNFALLLSDNIMLGIHGGGSLAALHVASQIQVFVQMLATGLEGGILVLGAQMYGKGDTEGCNKILNIGALLCLALGIVFMLLALFIPEILLGIFTSHSEIINTGATYLKIFAPSYPLFLLSGVIIASLKSRENTRVGCYVSATALGVKILLNYLLIFKFGSENALNSTATATVCARGAELAILLFYLIIVRRDLKQSIFSFLKPDLSLVPTFLKAALPILLSQIVWGASTLYANALLSNKNLPALTSALGISNTIYTLGYVVMNGLSGALGIITAENVGKGDTDTVYKYKSTMEIVFLSLGILTGGLMFFLKAPFLSLYNLSAEAYEISSSLISILSFTIIFTYYENSILNSLVKSGGDVKFTMKNDAFFLIFFTVPASLLASSFGISKIWLFFILKVDQILKCTVAFFKIRTKSFLRALS